MATLYMQKAQAVIKVVVAFGGGGDNADGRTDQWMDRQMNERYQAPYLLASLSIIRSILVNVIDPKHPIYNS